MNLSYRIIKDLYLLNRNFCSDDYDKAVDYISDIIPCEIHKFPSNGDEDYHGWVIPRKWDLRDAYIKKDGEVIYDATDHPLKVICMSAPFQGKVSLEELKRHLHYKTHHNIEDEAIPYHFRQSYQSWKRDWGFNVPQRFYQSLTEGTYEVMIDTKEEEGYLKIIESVKKGREDESFYFVAHLDHPGMANDDLAGCAAGIELFNRLREKDTKFTYKLLIVPEIIGSEYFLGHLSQKMKDSIFGSLFLEMLGSDTELGLQYSYEGDTLADYALEETLQEMQLPYHNGDFRTIMGNDEIVFEAHEIPMPSLSRYPFREYHTSKDDLSIISKEALEESVHVLERIVEKLEAQTLVKKQFGGLVCLSNPEYDLYVDLGEKKEFATEENVKLRELMDAMAFLRKLTTTGKLAARFDLDEQEVLAYLRKWEDKGLISLI